MYNFEGSIDEIVIYNRTLSENEIKALYNSKLYKFQNNFSQLKNLTTYTFQGCTINQSGFYSCLPLQKFFINTSYLPTTTFTSNTLLPFINIKALIEIIIVVTGFLLFN